MKELPLRLNRDLAAELKEEERGQRTEGEVGRRRRRFVPFLSLALSSCEQSMVVCRRDKSQIAETLDLNAPFLSISAPEILSPVDTFPSHFPPLSLRLKSTSLTPPSSLSSSSQHRSPLPLLLKVQARSSINRSSGPHRSTLARSFSVSLELLLSLSSLHLHHDSTSFHLRKVIALEHEYRPPS